MGLKLDSLMGEINKTFKEDLVHKGLAEYDYERIPFTSPRLNYMTFGGLPMGKLIEFYGVEHSGKALGMDCDILTPRGYKKMRDIEVGDEVIDGHGHTTKVIGVYPQGVKPMYRITFADHSTIKCSDEHLWEVNCHNRNVPHSKVLSTTEIYETYKQVKSNGRSYFLYSLNTPIITDIDEQKSLPIDPYLLGILIGDGNLTGRGIGVSIVEKDLKERVSELISDWDMGLHNNSKKCPYDYSISHKNNVYNSVQERGTSLKKELDKLGLNCKSIDKHIPREYLYTSVENRVALLQGLYDTDGYTDKRGSATFYTSSEQLSEDFAFLVRSLGGIDMVTSDMGQYKKDGEIIECNTCYNHHIVFRNGIIPCSSKKHLSRYIPNRIGMYYRKIVNVEPIEPMECQCIKVESDCHTFIAENVIVTHNTTSSLDIVANYQNMERQKAEQDPKYEPRTVVYADLENTLDNIWATKLGVDVNNMYIFNPTNQGAETVFEQLLKMIDTGEVGLIVIDSLGVMVSNQALEKSVEDKTYGGIAMALTNFSKKAEMLCHKYKCTLIGINQMRADMNSQFGGMTTTGGMAWRHNCFGGNTKFVTDKGLRRFRDCKEGEEVTVIDKDGNLRKATVHCYGKQPMQKVTFRTPNSHFDVLCTKDHRWLLSNGEFTENLKVGDKLYYRPENIKHEITTTRQAEMFCLGMAIADGCDYTSKMAIGIRVTLCGDKVNYSNIFEMANYRRCMQSGGYVGYTKLHISKQSFLDGECWKYLSAEDNRYLFMGYYAGDGSNSLNKHGYSCVTYDERVLHFIEYTSSLCGYFITSIKNFVSGESSYCPNKVYTRVMFTTHTNKYNGWVVESIKPMYDKNNVYCVEEPITHTFTLERGIVTGNCSVRIEFRMGKYFDDKGNDLTRGAENPAGNYVLVQMTKNKTCPPTRRTGFYTLNYLVGIDYLKDLVEVAMKFNLIAKGGAWYSILDAESGEQLEKVQGVNKVYDYLENHQDVLKKIEDYIDIQISNRDNLDLDNARFGELAE